MLFVPATIAALILLDVLLYPPPTKVQVPEAVLPQPPPINDSFPDAIEPEPATMAALVPETVLL